MKTKIFAGLMAMASGLIIACSPTSQSTNFDRPGLMALANEDVQSDLRAADRHILVVRHARKISEDCNALNCPLSPLGDSMAAKLATVIGQPAVDAAYSSAACRTLLTAQAGGLDPVLHQAADGYEVGCIEGDVITRARSEAFEEATNSDNRWTIVGEHSNTSCLWISQFVGEEDVASAGCVEGRLPSSAYGHVYWLYRTDNQWNLTVLSGAFEVAEAG